LSLRDRDGAQIAASCQPLLAQRASSLQGRQFGTQAMQFGSVAIARYDRRRPRLRRRSESQRVELAR
jgi:hypothetical protein